MARRGTRHKLYMLYYTLYSLQYKIVLYLIYASSISFLTLYQVVFDMCFKANQNQPCSVLLFSFLHCSGSVWWTFTWERWPQCFNILQGPWKARHADNVLPPVALEEWRIWSVLCVIMFHAQGPKEKHGHIIVQDTDKVITYNYWKLNIV